MALSRLEQQQRNAQDSVSIASLRNSRFPMFQNNTFSPVELEAKEKALTQLGVVGQAKINPVPVISPGIANRK